MVRAGNGSDDQASLLYALEIHNRLYKENVQPLTGKSIKR
jgi:hypothetical protein